MATVSGAANRQGAAIIPQLGATWCRAALQVNPYGYNGTAAPSRFFASEEEYNRLIVQKCEELEIRLIGITDHWCVDSAAGLIGAAEAQGIVALPGFEANSSEGIHLLVLFEQGTSSSTVNAAIGDCGGEPGRRSGPVGKSFEAIVESMSRRKALVIPAHANAGKGLLMNQSGMVLERRIKLPDLHAIGISPGIAPADCQADVLSGRTPFERQHELAEIYADDVCAPQSLETPGATTWFKASRPSLAAIDLAIRTPATRVRLSNPINEARCLIRSIWWEGGFLDGTRIDFSDDLTALIGGRGAGKSTVIESLRYALDLSPLGAQASRDHHALIDQVLGPGARVSIIVDAVSPTPMRYMIQRTTNQPAVVFDASETPCELRPQDVVEAVEIFGQHELAELAQDKSAIAQMVERFKGRSDDGYDRDELVGLLRQNRASLEDVEHKQELLEDALNDLPRLEAQQEQFKANRVADRLADQRHILEDESHLETATSRINALEAELAPLLDGTASAEVIRPIDGLAGSPRANTLSALDGTLTTISTAVDAAAESTRLAISRARSEITAIKESWHTETDAVRESVASVMRTMSDQGIDVDRFSTTVAQLARLRSRVSERAMLDRQRTALLDARKQILERLRRHDEGRATSLRTAIRLANEALGGAAFVKPVPAADRDHIKAVLKANVHGQRTTIMHAIDAPDFSVATFIETIRENGHDGVMQRYAISGAQADAVVNAGAALLRTLEEHAVPLAAEVSLDVGAAGRRDYRELGELSKGQRATALLLLLLSASTAPLVIDQPEDDLDNRFIFDGVVKHLRQLKGRRQIIASTHNANVPVLGDAELVVTLEADGRRGGLRPDGVGSLDVDSVRNLARNLLEGGRAAFEARQHIYGY